MGKTRPVKARRKQREALNNPTGKPNDIITVADLQNDQEQSEQAQQEQITLLKRIDSPNNDERYWAIGSLARLVMEESTIFQKVAQNSNIIDRLIKRISDPENTIRAAACGVLRNLTAIGDLSTSEKIISQDCLSSLFQILSSFETTKFEPDNEEGKEIFETLIENVLETLINLSECSIRPVEEILTRGFIPLLFNFIRPNTANGDIALASAELLAIITEDLDGPLGEKIRQSINQDNILLLKITLANQKNPALLRTLSCEILLNVCSTNDRIEITNIAMPTLVYTLQLNAFDLFLEFSKNPEIITSFNENVLPEQVEKRLDSWEDEVKAQNNSLQILSNILVDESAMDPMVLNQDITVSEGILELFMSNDICNKILPKCFFMDQAILNFYSFKMFKKYLDNYWRLQSRALSCINNVLLCFPARALGDIPSLWKMMFNLTGLSFSMSSNIVPETSLTEIQTIYTSILYSILRKFHNFPLPPNEVESIFKLTTHPNEQIRTNGFELIGCISKTPIGDSIIGEIGPALLRGLNDSSIWVSSASLDTIFTTFDDQYHKIFYDLKYDEQLMSYLHKIKALKKQLKNSKEEDELMMDRIDEVILNVPEFLQYVKKQAKS